MHYVVSIQVQRVGHQPTPNRPPGTNGDPKRTITELAKVTVRSAEFQRAIIGAKAHLDLVDDSVTDDTQGEGKVYRER